MKFLNGRNASAALALAIALAVPAFGAGNAWAQAVMAGQHMQGHDSAAADYLAVPAGSSLTVTGNLGSAADDDASWVGPNLPSTGAFPTGATGLTLIPGHGLNGAAGGFTGGNATVTVTVAGAVLLLDTAAALIMGGVGNGGAGDSATTPGGNAGTATLTVGGNMTVDGTTSTVDIVGGVGGLGTVGMAGAGFSHVVSVGGLFSTIGAAAGTGGAFNLTAGAGGATTGVGTGGDGGSIVTSYGSMDIWSASALTAGAAGAATGTGGASGNGGDISQTVSGDAVIGTNGAVAGTHTVIAGAGGIVGNTNASDGGNGGNVTESCGSLTVKEAPAGALGGNVAYTIGGGGNTAGSGDGGQGGSVNLTVAGALTAEGTFTVTQGVGGTATSTGNAGNAGGFTATLGIMDVAAVSTFSAGAGGDGNAATASAGAGGNGSFINLTVNGGAHYRSGAAPGDALVFNAAAGGTSGNGQGGNGGGIKVIYGPDATTNNALRVDGNFASAPADGGQNNLAINGGDASKVSYQVNGNSDVTGNFTTNVGNGGKSADTGGGLGGTAKGGMGSTFAWNVLGDSAVQGNFVKTGAAGGEGAQTARGEGGDSGDWLYVAQRSLNIGGNTAITGNAGGQAIDGAGGVGQTTTLTVGFDLSTGAVGTNFAFAGGAGGNSDGAGAGGVAQLTSMTVGRDFISHDDNVTFAAGLGGAATAAGNAANGGNVKVDVARDLLTAGNVTAAAGAAQNKPATGAGHNGNGGDLTINVQRVFQADDGLSTFAAGNGGNAVAANTNVPGANGGNLVVNTGTFNFQDTSFAGGNAGVGGNGGHLTAIVNRRAASFDGGFTGTGGNANTNIASATNGAGGDITFTNGDINTGGDVFVSGGFGLAGGQGVAAQPTAVTNAGTASFTARSLLGLTGLNNAIESGGTRAHVTPGGGAFGAGTTNYETRFTRNDATNTLLRVRKNEGVLNFRTENLVTFDGNANGINPGRGFTVSFDSPTAANVASGNNASFANAVMTNGSLLTIRQGDGIDNFGGYTWDANGTIYAANAAQNVNGYNPNKLVVGVANLAAAADAVTAYEQVSAANRTVHFDVANVRPTPNTVNTGILLVNNDAPTATQQGLLMANSTNLVISGADNLRLGQTVDLVNVAGGSSVPGLTNGLANGTLGDGYGNVADARYSLAWSGVHNEALQFTLGAFNIRNNWVINLDRDLQTVDAADVRTLRVPGTLSIVDNPFIGRDDIGIVVDDQLGTQGSASLWANRIEVATVNDLTNVWQTPDTLATVTTLDFRQAVAGNLADRNSHGVAFGALALRSASETHFLGDMGATGGNYAFGGHLEVGTMFRAEHASARLTNDATAAGQALTVNRLTAHLANDLASRLNGLSQTGAGGLAALEVVGGQAPIVNVGHPWSVDMSQSLASLDAMETLRRTNAAAGLPVPRFALIDRINGNLSTINGQTFAQNGNARLAARSWAGRGFLEGVYALGYGDGADWGTDSITARYQGQAADLGKSALQARSGAELLLGQGQDLIVDLMGNSMPVGVYDPAKNYRTVALGAMSGGYRSVKTGSDASGTAFSVAAGPGLSVDCDNGRSTLGALLEAGWGDFDLNNYFAWRGGFDADADSSYYGLALVARHEYFSGLYGEASIRGGVVDTDYKGHQSRTDFSTDSAYFGGHLGLGYKFDAWPDGMVDVYAKGLFTFMDGDDTDNTAGEHLKLDSSTSVRSRLGVRLSHNFTPEIRGYVGGAWEYEFDGEQKGTVSMTGSSNVVGIPAIDTKGHTGLGELGFEWAAGQDLTVGAGFQGAFGQREGYGGTLRLTYSW